MNKIDKKQTDRYNNRMSTEEIIRRAASILGSRKSPRKARSSAENGRKYGGRPKGSKNKRKTNEA